MTYADSDNQTPKKFRFGIKTLLVVVGIVCLGLSRYYPRIYIQATIDCGASNLKEARTHSLIIKAPVIVAKALKSLGEDPSDSRIVTSICEELTTNVTEENLIELRIVGPNKDRKELKSIVEAVTNAYVKYMENDRVEFSAQAKKLLEDNRVALADDQSENADLLRQAVNKRLKDLHKQIPAILPPQAKVVETTSGWAF